MKKNRGEEENTDGAYEKGREGRGGAGGRLREEGDDGVELFG